MIEHGFKGLDRDTSFKKRDPNMYWDAQNIRINLSDGNLFLTPLLGNTERISLTAGIYIIGYQVVADYLYIFTTDNAGVDSIMEIDSDFNITTLYTADLNFSIDAPIESIANIENDNIWKIYWVDGVNQLRHINVKDPDISSLDSELLNMIPATSFSQPEVTAFFEYGQLKAGKIQYAYSLYTYSGAETKLSPISALHPIGNGIDGGDVEEVMPMSLEVTISDIDTKFDIIKIYSIHYTNENSIPAIKLITEEALAGDSITIVDSGTSTISTLSMDEVLTIGGDLLIPYTLNTKKQRLFVANYKVNNFDVDFDARAYAWNSTPGSVASIKTVDGVVTTLNSVNDPVPDTHDAINKDNSIYRFTSDGTTLGREGPNIKITYDKTLAVADIPSNADEADKYRSLKRGETYRVGIKFYDTYGNESPVKWISDVTIDDRDYTDSILRLKVELTQAAISDLKTNGAVAHQIVRVQRTKQDRTILSQGFITPSFQRHYDSVDSPISDSLYPYYITKDITTELGGNISWNYNDDLDFLDGDPSTDTRYLQKHDDVQYFYSPDASFDTVNSVSDIHIIGASKLVDASTRYYVHDVGIDYENLRRNRYEGFSDLEFQYPGTFITGSPPNHLFDDTDGYDTDYGYNVNFIKHYEGITPNASTLTIPLSENSINVNRASSELLDSGLVADLSMNAAYFTGYYGAGGMAGFVVDYNDSVLLQFADREWHTFNPTGQPAYITEHEEAQAYNKFKSVATSDRYLPIVELVNHDLVQYGGNSYEARQRNSYLTVGDYVVLDSANAVTVVGNGDIYISKFNVERVSNNNKTNSETWMLNEFISLYLESNINVDFRNDDSQQVTDTYDSFMNGKILFKNIDDWAKYNKSYNQESVIDSGLAKPFNFRDVNEFPNKIIASDAKFNNELVDSWLNFRSNNTLELKSIYGPIMKLQELRDELFAFQNKAVARLAIQPRVQTVANDGDSIELGSGGVLHDYGYLTTTSGTYNKWGISKDKRSIFYYDEINNTINVLQQAEGSSNVRISSEQEVTTLAGLDSFFKENIKDNISDYIKNNPYKGTGVFTYYDNINEDINISFLGAEDYQLVYNLLSKTFTSFRDPVSNTAIDFNGKIVTTTKSSMNKLYEEYSNTVSNFFGSVKEAYITLLSAGDALFNKIFNNVEFQTETDIPDKIHVWNDYQDSGEQVFDVKQKYRKYRGLIPRESGSRNRLADTKAYIKLIYTKDKFMKLYDIIVKYSLKRP